MVRRVHFSVALLLTFAAQVSTARADPIQLTGGTAVLGTFPFMYMSVEGIGLPNLTLLWRTADLDALPFLCSGGGCGEGDSVTLSTTVATSGPVHVSEAANEVVGSGGYAYTGSVAFQAPLVTLPPTGGDPDARALFAEPFTFFGVLTAWQVLGVLEPIELDTFTLIGQGTVRVGLPADGRGGYDWGTMRYEFSPVPEPATLLLVGGGMAALGLRRRRQ
jgi:hypothetical protein